MAVFFLEEKGYLFCFLKNLCGSSLLKFPFLARCLDGKLLEEFIEIPLVDFFAKYRIEDRLELADDKFFLHEAEEHT